ncbi:MAG: class I SAM-dependent methyltransferase, partial [Coriobacteriales bacterium]|nr:class I SAM-dependent methyltransferase [Coriobacteriales bacterium]
MNPETLKKICALNNAFYRDNSASFSKTRQSPWPGWTRCLEVLKSVQADERPAGSRLAGDQTGDQRAGDERLADDELADDGQTGEQTGAQQALSVFDLACGNLRFENFLASALPETTLNFYAVDNCDRLVQMSDMKFCAANQEKQYVTHPLEQYTNCQLNYQNLDVLDALGADLCLNDQLAAPLCDLSVSFGFLHHVPLAKYREEILASLVRQTRPGGLVIVSLWQFLNDETLAKRARATHKRALQELGLPALDDND